MTGNMRQEYTKLVGCVLEKKSKPVHKTQV